MKTAPEAEGLLLIGQVLPAAAVVVEGGEGAGAGGVREVLRAPVRGKVREAAGELGGLRSGREESCTYYYREPPLYHTTVVGTAEHGCCTYVSGTVDKWTPKA